MLFGRRKRTINRILVVEDEPLVAFDNEHFLQDAGFEIVATVDGAEAAVARIEVGGIDLVVTDVKLSDGSGVDVARAAHGRGVPVMFVTGNCPGDAKAWAIGCLSKPYSQRDLRAAIDIVDDIVSGREPGRASQGFTVFARE